MRIIMMKVSGLFVSSGSFFWLRVVKKIRFQMTTRPQMWVIVGVLTMTGPATMAGQANAASTRLSTQEVRFHSGDVTLHGTIWAPIGAKHPLPGMVLVHGSGPGPRTANMLEAETFARSGIVTLAYDKRTVGYSLFQRSYAQLANDALAALELLRSNSKVDPRMVGLWGESEGTWVVPLAASRSPDVAFVILVGASGVSPSRQQAWFLGNLLRHDGISGSMLTALPITSVKLLIGANLFAEAHFDAVPSLEHLYQPVLAVWSTHDYSHPPQEASHIIQHALDHAGNTHYTMRFFAESDPKLHRSTDGFTHLEGLTPGYADLVANWVRDVAAGHPPITHVEPAPRQERQSQELAPLAWYESAPVELAVIILFLAAFAGYPLATIARRISRSGQVAVVGWPAWLVSTAGLITTLFFPVYVLAAPLLLPAGPLIFDRPLSWLAFQALAVITVMGTILAVFTWWRRSSTILKSEQIRLGLLVLGGIVFGVWAIYWGLLIP